MPRVVGIDPGTHSLDLVGLDDGAPFLERSFPEPDPDGVVEALLQARPLDLVAGPSGYGLPLVPIEDVGPRELRLMLLPSDDGGAPLRGLGTLVERLRGAQLPVVFLPGVIHLPSVPAHRKANRIDLGTADKVCAAAAAIADQARARNLEWTETSFVLVELGGAFTAVVSVDAGAIVSGLGGSSGPLGYEACGALDAEVACLIGPVTKATIFSGGFASIARRRGPAPVPVRGGDAGPRLARDAFVEAVVRAVAGELSVVPRAREILLSGRLSRIEAFRDPLLQSLEGFGPVRVLSPRATVKEAAAGAALLADGLAGGRYAGLVDALRLREAAGSVLDHLYLDSAARAEAWLARES
jgi:predicted butyrate kinase (DUF1464 family)